MTDNPTINALLYRIRILEDQVKNKDAEIENLKKQLTVVPVEPPSDSKTQYVKESKPKTRKQK